MAFRTDQPLQQAFSAAISRAAGIKAQLQRFSTALAGNITANDALGMAAAIREALTLFNASSAVPGVGAYAQAQYNDATYDVATEFSSMTTALQAVLTWLENNIPANSVSVTSASLTSASFTSAQTAPLLTLVNSAIATIA